MIHVFNLLSGISLFLVLGVSGVRAVSFSLIEGDSVTLHTAVIKQPHEDFKWYFNDIRIAQLDGDFSDMCTDVQCNEGTERFRDRLKLDNQTGSLTIINIRNPHSGLYQVLFNGNRQKIFNITVHDDPDAHHNQVNKNQGESVTFNPGVRRDLIDVMKCFFNDILIAEITGGQSQTCTDVQCKERFTERLKLDSESGSLTVMNTRNTDSGNYTLEIFISSDRNFSITKKKRFSLTVISLSRSHLSGGEIAAVVVVVVVLVVVVVAAGVIYYLRHRNDGAAAQPEGVADDPSNIPLRLIRDS